MTTSKQIQSETTAIEPTSIRDVKIPEFSSDKKNECKVEKQSSLLKDVDLLKYKKMVTVGIPIQSVAHKMKVDGLNQNTIDVFMDESHQSGSNTIDNDKVALPHINKRPREAIQPTTSHDVKKVELNTETNSKEQLLNLEHDSELFKYKKMVSVGIPIQSVAHKMKADEINPDKIDIFLASHGIPCGGNKTDLAASKSQSETSGISGVLSNNTQLATVLKLKGHQEMKDGNNKNGNREVTNCETNLSVSACKKKFDNDDELSKFRKMASFGVPYESIANKMRQESISAEKIDLFEIAFGLKLANNSIQQRSQGGNPIQGIELPLPPPISRRTSVKMQKIHWKAVSEEKLGDSLWANTTDYDSDIDDKEVKQLESLFGATQAKPTSNIKKQRTTNSSNVKNSCLIDMKRANNIAIALAQYRSYQKYDDLCRAVVSMDSCKLSAEQLQNMRALLPTMDELKKMKQYNGRTEGLVRAELFFLSVSKFPRFAQKLETFIFSLLFNAQMNELRDSCTKLKQACEDVVHNKKLAAILRKLLAVGNLVNEGAGKPRARGITVDSLLKTAKRTGSDGKTTVIYIVIANFLKQEETGASVDFWNEMGSVRDAARIDIKDCKSSFREIQMGLKKANLSMEAENISVKETNNVQHSIEFLQRSSDFIVIASQEAKIMERTLLEVDESVKVLCSFFAEDPKICQVCIFIK
jgi:hypothetical protein